MPNPVKLILRAPIPIKLGTPTVWLAIMLLSCLFLYLQSSSTMLTVARIGSTLLAIGRLYLVGRSMKNVSIFSPYRSSFSWVATGSSFVSFVNT